MCQHNAIAYVIDLVRLGKITTDEANVLKVRLMGVSIIMTRLRKETRNALNKAVKNKKLGHLKKEGLLPEAYYHINAKRRAMEERSRIANKSIERLKKVYIAK